jgi:hypothetical protein
MLTIMGAGREEIMDVLTVRELVFKANRVTTDSVG